jgi:hypothetical protein
MKQRSSAAARALAVTALVAGFLVPAALIAGALGGGSSGSRERPPAGRGGGRLGRAGAYVIRNGDTLSSIARRTGVPVARIQRLNPGVDPRILISGEKLKLRR